jgi:hypothetical protein
MTANDPYTRPSAGSAALVLIDMRRDFVDMPGGDAAMPVEDTYALDPGDGPATHGLPAAGACVTASASSNTCAKAAAIPWFSRDVTSRTALARRSRKRRRRLPIVPVSDAISGLYERGI